MNDITSKSNAATRITRDRWYHSLISWIWGYDFFVSYNQASAGPYAAQLAEELRRHGYDVFLDCDEIAGGDSLSEVVKAAIRKTQRLVVVATKEALSGKSPWVAKEIVLFTSTNRQCIAIVFPDSFVVLQDDTPEKEAARTILKNNDKLHIPETVENLRQGSPDGTNVIKKLIATHGIMRRRSLRRTITFTAVLLLAMFAGFASISWINAVIARNDATEQERIAKAEKAKAEKSEEQQRIARQNAERNLGYNNVYLAHREWHSNNVSQANEILNRIPRHLRHFEWGYVKRLCELDRYTCDGHKATVSSAIVTPDNKHIVSASLDGIVNVWDAARGTHLRTAYRQSQVLKNAAVSNDGALVGATGEDGSLHVWSTDNSERVLGTTGTFSAVTFSDDSTSVVTAMDGNLHFWDATTGAKTREFKAVGSRFLSVAVSPDENYIAAGKLRSVQLWNVEKEQKVVELDAYPGPVEYVEFDSEGRRFAYRNGGFGRFGGRFIICDGRTGQTQLEVESAKGDELFAFAFSQDGRRFATGSVTGRLRIHDSANGQVLSTIDAHDDVIGSLEFEKGGGRLVSTSGGTTKIWNITTQEEIASFDCGDSFVLCASFVERKKGVQLATVDSAANVLIRNTPDWKQIAAFRAYSDSVISIAISPDGENVASSMRVGRSSSEVYVWKVASGKVLHRFQTGLMGGYGLTFSPSGKLLASAALSGDIVIWNLESDKEPLKFNGPVLSHHGVRVFLRILSIAFSNNEKFLAFAGRGSLTIWDLETSERRMSYNVDNSAAHSLAFSPNDRLLVWGFGSRFMVVELGRSKPEKTTYIDSGEIFDVAFHPAGGEILTAITDGTVRIWDLASSQFVVAGEGVTKPIRIGGLTPEGDPAGVFAQPSRTLRRHNDWTTCVRYSSDGSLIVSGSSDKTVRLWDAQSGEAKDLADVPGMITEVRYSPDGNSLAVCNHASAGLLGRRKSVHGEVRVFDADSGAISSRIAETQGGVTGIAIDEGTDSLVTVGPFNLSLWNANGTEVYSLGWAATETSSVAFSPDGKWFAISASGPEGRGEMLLWDTEHGSRHAVLRGHNERISCIAFDHSSRRIVSASEDNSVRVWDVATRAQLKMLSGPEKVEIISHVAFSPDDATIVAGAGTLDANGHIIAWDLDTEKRLYVKEAHTDPVVEVAFSKNGDRVISASRYNIAVVWNSKTGEKLGSIEPDLFLESVVFNDEDEPLALYQTSAGFDRGFSVWNVSSNTKVCDLAGLKRHASLATFNSSGSQIVAVQDDMIVKTWDAKTGAELSEFRREVERIAAIAFAPDEKTIALAPEFTTINFWNHHTGKVTSRIGAEVGYPRCVDLSPDGNLIACGGMNHDRSGHLSIRDKKTGDLRHQLIGHGKQVLSVCFSPDGKLLASSGQDEVIKLWRVHDGEHLQDFSGHEGAVLRTVFNSHGTLIASASEDKTIRIWSVELSKELQQLTGHTDVVTSVDFSFDGKRLVSASLDKTLKIWDPETGQEILALRNHRKAVHCVAFSPDMTQLISGSSGEGYLPVAELKLWPAISWKTGISTSQ